MRPQSGKMYWWKLKGQREWKFGYCTYIPNQHSLVRMGTYNGDTTGGSVVTVSELEWKDY